MKAKTRRRGLATRAGFEIGHGPIARMNSEESRLKLRCKDLSYPNLLIAVGPPWNKTIA
jgi:hypothetical protein